MAEQKKEEMEIKTYKMIEGDYTVQVRILEANDLVPTNSGFSIFKSKGSAVNAFVEVNVAGQIRRTKVVKGQLSPIFNQLMSFKLKDLKKAQISSFTITIAAYDRKNAIVGNTIIGSYELDLTSVYFSYNHEMYRTFFALSDPTDEREGQMGFILANVAVLGPNDEPVIHDVSTEKKADATKGVTLVPKKINQWSHQIKVNLLRGEHMVPLDLTTAEIDAYVTMKYGGAKIKSKVVTSRNPQWMQQLNIGCMLPNQSKFIDIAVYDHDLLGDDDLAGQFQLPFKDIPERQSDPMWLNLYGAPLKGEGKEADMMNLYGATMGSHYRGRILFTICRFDMRDAKTYKEDLKFKFPDNAMPNPEEKSYVLRVDLLEGHEFPTRKQIIVQIKIGPYLMVSQPGRQEEGTVMFYENLPDKKVLFPKAIAEIPDIIIYMADDNIEDRRNTFIRIKAADVLDKPCNARVLKMKEDRSLDLISDDEFPGFLYANIQLMSTNPGIRKPLVPDTQTKIEYELRVFLYIGRNLPPADATGTSDPVVKIRCAGQIAQSKVCPQTLNPGWYETLKLNVKLYPLDKEQIVPSGMFLMVFDEDKEEGEEPTYDLIGRIWITLQPELVKFQASDNEEPIDLLYRKPKWYNILYDATDEVQGQILLSYALVKKEDAHKVPEESLYPSCNQGNVHLFCIGLRNILDIIGTIEPSNVAVSFDISGDDYDPIFTDYKKVKSEGMNINRLISLKIDIPRNQNFCPVIDCYVWNKEAAEEPKLLGVTTIDLAKILENYYRRLKLPADAIMEEDSEDEEEQELMDMLDDKKKVKAKTVVQQVKDQDEIEENLDLDQIDLNVPWELPIKKQVYEEKEFRRIKKERQLEKQRIGEQGEEIIKKSVIGDSQLEDFDINVDDVPVYKATTYQQQQSQQPLVSQEQRQFVNSYIQESPIQNIEVQEQYRNRQSMRPPPSDDEDIIHDDPMDHPQQRIQSQQAQPQLHSHQNMINQSQHSNGVQQQVMVNVSQKSILGQQPQGQSQRSIQQQFNVQQQGQSQRSIQQHVQQQQSIQQPSQRSIKQQQVQDNPYIPDDYQPSPYRNNQPMESHHSHQGDPDIMIDQIQAPLIAPNQPESYRSIPLFPSAQNFQTFQAKPSVQGQIQHDLRNLGSQRSIRSISNIDQEVIFNTGQHHKNQLEVQEVLQRQQSQQSQLNHSRISQLKSLNASNMRSQLDQLPATKLYTTLKVKSDLSFSKASKVSSKALSINSGPKDNMDAVKKPKTKKKKVRDAKKNKFMNLASSFIPKKKKNEDIETYEDYDTDPGEDLNMTPPWLEGRKFLKDDLEDFMKPTKKFMKFSLFQGQSRGKDSKFLQEKQEPQQICDFKCIFLEEKKGQDIEVKKNMFQKMMRPKQYHCRLYILQGVDIQSGGEEPPDLYLKIRTADTVIDIKKDSLRNGNNPQFYVPYEIQVEVPGSCTITIEVWSQELINDEFVGKTVIDLEDRYFSIKWHKFDQKPIENRNLKDDFGSSIGRLQMWIELVEKSQVKANPLIKITAPPRFQFELRTIIYETRNCVFKDELEKCNDLYCKLGIANQELQETDTHWRCRAKGSFNWRVKNKITYPSLPDDFGSDKFKLQLWDKDIVSSDELIGECTFDLNTHKLIDKAVKRQQTVAIKQRIREKGGIITDRFWLDVYHPDALDEEGQKVTQGQALVSFELMPLIEVEKKPNGFGRDPPNVFPPLNEPTGRLSFDITNPLGFIKDILGPELYNKMWKAVCVILCLGFGCTFGWMFLGPLIAGVVTK